MSSPTRAPSPPTPPGPVTPPDVHAPSLEVVPVVIPSLPLPLSPPSPPTPPEVNAAGPEVDPFTSVVIDGEIHDISTFLYRVSDINSASPLEASGFTATAARFRGEPPTPAWTRARLSRRLGALVLGDSIAVDGSIIRHVLGRWGGAPPNAYTGPSVWIAVTTSLDWAVYEIARRLTNQYRPQTPTVELSFISKRKGTLHGHVMREAEGAIKRYGRDLLPGSGDNETAMNFARASSEHVIFGRIFASDIVITTSWSVDNPGFSPLETFMKPYFASEEDEWEEGTTWLENLSFNPQHRGPVAREAIRRRREQLAEGVLDGAVEATGGLDDLTDSLAHMSV